MTRTVSAVPATAEAVLFLVLVWLSLLSLRVELAKGGVCLLSWWEMPKRERKEEAKKQKRKEEERKTKGEEEKEKRRKKDQEAEKEKEKKREREREK